MASRNWDPNKLYNASDAEKRAVEERRQMRVKIKAEWQQKVTNPYRGVGGSIFDPNVQRFSSMKSTGMENFKATPKSSVGGVMFLGAVLGFAYYHYWLETSREIKIRSGQIAYKDRDFKTMQ